MVAIIRSIIALTSGIYSKIRYKVLDNESKKEFYNPRTNTYLNPKGHSIDMATGRHVRIEKDIYGDQVEVDIKTLKVLRNFSQEERDREYKRQCKDMSRTVYVINKQSYRGKACPAATGSYYFIDKYTNKYMFEKRYESIGRDNSRLIRITAYFDVETGDFVRLGDSTVKIIEKGYIAKEDADIVLNQCIKFVNELNGKSK